MNEATETQKHTEWQYEVTENIYPEYGPRKYRFNIDPSKGVTSVAQTSAEYFNEKYQQWRAVRSWNTKDWLYNTVFNPIGGPIAKATAKEAA